VRKSPDWQFWRKMPHIELWQAPALSLDIEPDSLDFSRYGWMSGEGPHIEEDSFPSAEKFVEYGKRLSLLRPTILTEATSDPAF
jgi:hypothetical protein